jgi:methionyl-tRNA synthetase
MLMSAGLPLPRAVWGHGFVTVNGEKLSKSRGNIVAPEEATSRFGVDGFRYLFLREVPFNRDGDFSWKTYADRFNADLANDLGNLFARTLTMVQRYLEGEVPRLGTPEAQDAALLEALRAAGVEYRAQVEACGIHAALAAVASLVQAANRYIEDTKPWGLAKRPEDRDRLRAVLRNLLEVLRHVSVLVQPAMPTKAVEMRRQLGLPDDFAMIRYDSEITIADRDWPRVHPGPPLFPRLEVAP